MVDMLRGFGRRPPSDVSTKIFKGQLTRMKSLGGSLIFKNAEADSIGANRIAERCAEPELDYYIIMNVTYTVGKSPRLTETPYIV